MELSGQDDFALLFYVSSLEANQVYTGWLIAGLPAVLMKTGLGAAGKHTLHQSPL